MFSNTPHKFVFFVLSSCLWSHPYDAIINLGGDCQPAYQLTANGLRAYALPFDALITPYASLQSVLENYFDGFLAPDNFEFVMHEDGTKYIRDKKYDIRLIHDFGLHEDFLKDYDEVAAKYLRRIERLLRLISTSEYPLFIRKRITREQAQALADVLHTMRDGKPFLLVVLRAAEEPEWDLDCIRNFYLRQPEPYTWKGDPQAWREIFQSIGLLTAQDNC